MNTFPCLWIVRRRTYWDVHQKIEAMCLSNGYCHRCHWGSLERADLKMKKDQWSREPSEPLMMVKVRNGWLRLRAIFNASWYFLFNSRFDTSCSLNARSDWRARWLLVDCLTSTWFLPSSRVLLDDLLPLNPNTNDQRTIIPMIDTDSPNRHCRITRTSDQKIFIGWGGHAPNFSFMSIDTLHTGRRFQIPQFQ